MKVTREGNKITNVEFTHEDLVNFFATALYGQDDIIARYPKKFASTIEEYHKQNPDACYEDIIAHLLLSGKYVHFIDDDKIYDINLDRISEMVIQALNSDDEDIIANVEEAFEMNEDACPDFYDAFNALQYIIYGEVIYG